MGYVPRTTTFGGFMPRQNKSKKNMNKSSKARFCVCREDVLVWAIPTRRKKNVKLKVFAKGSKYPYEILDNRTVIIYGDSYFKGIFYSSSEDRRKVKKYFILL